MRIRLFFIFLFQCFVQINYAQSNKNIDSLLKSFDELFKNSIVLTNEIIEENKGTKNNLIWFDFLNEKFAKENINQFNYPAEIKKSINNLGLTWVSDATYNFSPGFADSDNLFFRSKVATGFDWGILGQGSFLQQKKENDLFKKQIKIDSLKLVDLKVKTDLDNKKNISQLIFDNYRVNLLKKYAENLKQQAKYYDKLYNEKLCSYSEKLKANQKLDEVLDLIKLNEEYFVKNENIDLVKKYIQLPLSINFLPDLSLLNINQLSEDKIEILKLQNQILKDKNSINNKPSLKAKLRYNYYDSPNESGRNFASLGATFSVPIYSKNDQKVLDYEYELGNKKIFIESIQLREELVALHKGFAFLLNDLKHIQNEIIYLESLLENEIQINKSHNKDFSPAKYIKYADDLVKKQFEYISIKQKIFENFLTFYTLSKINNQNILIEEEVHLNTKSSSYLWSKFFNEKNNDDLINILKNNNINKLFLSPGNNKNKLSDFLNKSFKENIEISRLIGENSFALDDNGWIKLIEKLSSLKKEGYKSIHLDIEPHTFDDYKNNLEKYTEIMSNIFIKSKQWCDENNINLSVSIPMHLPLKNAEILNELKIESYIMAYDNVNQIKLLNKTESLRKALQNNFIWVLRLSDFKSIEALKQAEEELNNSGIYKIGYYDLSMLNALKNEN